MPIDISQPVGLQAIPVAQEAVRDARNFVKYCVDASSNIRTNPMSSNWVAQTAQVARGMIVAANALARDAPARQEVAYFFKSSQGGTNAKFTAMRDVAIAIRDWCLSALPRDPDGTLKIRKLDDEGDQTFVRFEVGTLNALADLMDTYVAAARG